MQPRAFRTSSQGRLIWSQIVFPLLAVRVLFNLTLLVTVPVEMLPRDPPW